MTKDTRNTLRDLFIARQEVALHHLHDDLQYIAQCKVAQELERHADDILQQLSKEDRMAVRHSIEAELQRASYETDAAYIQGLRDCLQFIGFLTSDQVAV